ncbi:MAG: glycosyltransferase family 2 protein [Pedobacter sp.]|jgi:glycosyltransferase involved in cell wall biosynthesis|uniref:glycosyltransferase family 2 protein n=1 Tax=Pedobacter sp. TaxID=1411316 RepID=UPI003561C73D
MISVCLATFNGEKYIVEQLDSILNQLGPDDEIIVSDDGSSDQTLPIIRGYADPRIHIFTNNERKGIVGNFENAMKNCKGDYIFLSDQDDVWLSQKVEISLEALIENDLVVTNCSVVDENLTIISPSYFEIANSKKGFLKNFYRSSYLGCCLAFNRKLLNIVLPIPASLNLFHDWWIGFLADLRFNVIFIETPCMLYRRHNLNVSTTTEKSAQKINKRIFDRLQLLYLGLYRLLKRN